MRVLMINSGSGVRSTGRMCTDLASELIEEGHEVKIGYARGNVPEKYQPISVRIGSSVDVYRQALMTRIFDNEGFGNKHSTKEFIKWVKGYDPDIIHLHNIHGYYLNSEVLFDYLKESNKPVIWTLHDCWSFTGHCAHFDYVGCDKWKTECFNCPLKKEYPGSYLLDGSKHNYYKKKESYTGLSNLILVSPSIWLSDFIKDSILKEYKTVVINNGINTDVFKPRKSDVRKRLKIENKIMILGVASTWNHRKGLDTFIALSGLLPVEKYKIVMVGLNKKQLQQIPDRIIGIESTDSVEELADFYSAADIFVNPTLEDNYPTTNLEAIACGTPVITYKTGGSPESANSYGIVIERDINKLKEAVTTFVEPMKRPIDLDYRTCVKKYIKLYTEIIRDRRI